LHSAVVNVNALIDPLPCGLDPAIDRDRQLQMNMPDPRFGIEGLFIPDGGLIGRLGF
jgi:hypothetical protein